LSRNVKALAFFIFVGGYVVFVGGYVVFVGGYVGHVDVFCWRLVVFWWRLCWCLCGVDLLVFGLFKKTLN
jgi:hypothetical protein